MRIKNLYALAVCCTIAFSCSDDANERSISGNWHLTNATTAEGTNLNYSSGEVTWTFNESNNTLSVQNSVMTLGPENTLAGPATGSYSFSVQRQQDIDYLYIDGTRIGAVANTGTNLVINSTGQNEVIKVFSR